MDDKQLAESMERAVAARMAEFEIVHQDGGSEAMDITMMSTLIACCQMTMKLQKGCCKMGIIEFLIDCREAANACSHVCVTPEKHK